MNNGLFISLEGPEGSGKSTIINKLYEWLAELIENKSINFFGVIKTREPGGYNNKLCEDIRNLILSDSYDIPPLTDALLFAASRSYHLESTIIPALEKNYIVLCDRFVDSSYVYQGFSTSLGVEKVIQINKLATNNILPNLTLVLMVSAEVGLERIKINNRETNKIDNKPIEYHKKIEEYYRELAKIDCENRIHYIDANSSSINTILDNCKEVILKYIHGHK